MEKLYTITELADELELTPRAIRFYETKSLLAPQRVGANRVYTHRDRARLKVILRGKRLGFSIAEIKEYIDLYDAEMGQVEQTKHLLRKIRLRSEDLRNQREVLEVTLDELGEMEKQALDALRSWGVKPDEI